MEFEHRSFPLQDVEIRSTADGRISFRGLAATYGDWSKDLGGFVEKIEPSAFTRALREGQDVPFLVNHDRNLFLGRTGTGTVRLSSTERGLLVEAESLPDTQAARDLKALGGEVRSMSFGFRVPKGGDSWDWRASPAQRSLRDVDLGDVSVLTGATPAYNDTTAEVRALVEEHAERAASDYAGMTDAVKAKFKSDLADTSKNPTDHVTRWLQRCHQWAAGTYPRGCTYSDVRFMAQACVNELHKRDAKSTASMDDFPPASAGSEAAGPSDSSRSEARCQAGSAALAACAKPKSSAGRSLRAVGDVIWDSENAFQDWQSDVQASLPDGPGYPWGAGAAWVDDISLDGTKALVCCYMDGGYKTWVVPLTVVDGDPVAAPMSEWVEAEQQYVAASAARDLARAISLFEQRAGAMLSAKSKGKISDAMSAMREAHGHLEQLMADAGDGPLVSDSSDTFDLEMASLDRRIRLVAAGASSRVDTRE